LKYNKIFIYTFLSSSRTGQTAHQIFMLDGSNDADSCKGVDYIAAHLGDQIAKKPKFLGYK